MRVCPNCGEENPDRFRLCGYCGTPLAPAPPAQEVRKTVTVVFSRPEGLDRPRRAARLRVAARGDVALLRRHARGARAPRRDDREVHRRRGDGRLRAAELHEDDALRARPRRGRDAGGARRAQRRARATLGRAAAEPHRRQHRRGGRGRSAAGQRLVTGDAVNVAARLEQAAPANGVLLGELDPSPGRGRRRGRGGGAARAQGQVASRCPRTGWSRCDRERRGPRRGRTRRWSGARPSWTRSRRRCGELRRAAAPGW